MPNFKSFLQKIRHHKSQIINKDFPDTCNVITWITILLTANCGTALFLFLQNKQFSAFAQRFLEIAFPLEFITITTLIFLCSAHHWLTIISNKTSRFIAYGIVTVFTMSLTIILPILTPFFTDQYFSYSDLFIATLTSILLVLFWLDTRHRSLKKATNEAKLIALSARIRPHFLFNSLNTVLGVIRTDSKKAEILLTELSELIQELMRNEHVLVPLSEEINLSKKYLDIEKLRLEDRLEVIWDLGTTNLNAFVPSLILQPLLENAVYHGIETNYQPKPIKIVITESKSSISIQVSNSEKSKNKKRHIKGNQLALKNIQERLTLFYGSRSKIQVLNKLNLFEVTITIPI